MKQLVMAVFITAIMIGSVAADGYGYYTNTTAVNNSSGTTVRSDTNVNYTSTTPSVNSNNSNSSGTTVTNTGVNTDTSLPADCTQVTRILCTTRTIERCTNETGIVRCTTESKPYCLNRTETKCTGENIQKRIREEIKYKHLNRTAHDLTDNDTDDLLEEVEIEHPENFTKHINQGRLISEIEQVKKEYLKSLLHELRDANSTANVSIYATRFNKAMNALKEDIRTRMQNNETLTIDVVQELAKRQLLNITGEINAGATVSDDQLVSLILNRSNGKYNESDIRSHLAQMSPEFKRKLLQRLLTQDIKEDHPEIGLQIKAINQEYKAKIEALRMQMHDLNKERIDKIRQLLNSQANASTVVETEAGANTTA